MKKIPLLPYWQLPDSIPSVYDTQSGSYQEMVAKVYGAMRTLQTEYNSFVDEINKTITDFINSTNQDQECFKKQITKIMHDYIIKIDEKIKMQDLVIDNAVKFMKDNIMTSLDELYKEMYESGEFDKMTLDTFKKLDLRVSLLENTISTYSYDSNSETLIISMGGTV